MPSPSFAFSFRGRCRPVFLPLLLVIAAMLAAPARAQSAAPATAPTSTAAPGTGREVTRLNAGWRFALGHPSDTARDFDHATGYFSYLTKTGFGDGPAAREFDDRAWRRVDLPHDWAVELPFAANASHSHGYKTIGPRFPDTSVGWYRRTFPVPAADLGRRVVLRLDGAFRAARVFINGFYVGTEPSGYATVRYDLTDYLNYGGDNVIAVRVDATMEEGWFYEGAGIYRHVWLEKHAPLHVAPDGTFVTTTLNTDHSAATVTVATTVAQALPGTAVIQPAPFRVTHTILGPDGASLASTRVDAPALAAGTSTELPATLTVTAPQLWSLESPVLHRLVTTITQDSREVDRYETTFGIRTVRFDPDHGFFLNDRHVVLKGTNNHQDHAGVGVALPDALQDFRILRLKAMGGNAYRASHNPATRELLEACDRLGFLVIDETRLMGSNPLHLDPLERMIRRGRNHPSIILWSLGNEEWAIEGNETGARLTRSMEAFARRLDPTRRLTVAISGGWGGISRVVDVMGVNYIRHGSTDQQHADFPHQPILGTEETTTQGTRGIYFDARDRGHMAPLVDGTSGGNLETGWRHYAARPYLAGVFYWTGFDYRGEPNPLGFPAVLSQFGILDTCGFPKDGFHYLRAWWTEEPVLHVFPHWNWPGREGQPITVSVHSNAAEVELFLDGRSLGRKPLPPRDHLEWVVPYAPGTLTARGYRPGAEPQVTTVTTTGAPARLRLTSAFAGTGADGVALHVITVDALDAAGRPVPTAGDDVTFTLAPAAGPARGAGGARILGVGNGDPGSHEADVFPATVTTTPATGWRQQVLSATTADLPKELARVVAPGFDDDAWPAAFTRGASQETAAPPAPAGATLVYRARLTVPIALPAGTQAELLLTWLGEEQTVLLDGQPIAPALRRTGSAPTLAVPAALLTPGEHHLAIVVTPFAETRRAEEATRTRVPAQLRVESPAGPARRRLFNGLAQVIIGAPAGSAPTVLQAAAPGLASGELPLVFPAR